MWIVGRNVTPQQARNMIKRIENGGSAEQNARDMLHCFVQTAGNDVLILHDQFDITCGIVLQTRMQKEFFKEWGESIVMDWTHGTNNLGFHMGMYLLAFWHDNINLHLCSYNAIIPREPCGYVCFWTRDTRTQFCCDR